MGRGTCTAARGLLLYSSRSLQNRDLARVGSRIEFLFFNRHLLPDLLYFVFPSVYTRPHLCARRRATVIHSLLYVRRIEPYLPTYLSAGRRYTLSPRMCSPSSMSPTPLLARLFVFISDSRSPFYTTVQKTVLGAESNCHTLWFSYRYLLHRVRCVEESRETLGRFRREGDASSHGNFTIEPDSNSNQRAYFQARRFFVA